MVSFVTIKKHGKFGRSMGQLLKNT